MNAGLSQVSDAPARAVHAKPLLGQPLLPPKGSARIKAITMSAAKAYACSPPPGALGSGQQEIRAQIELEQASVRHLIDAVIDGVQALVIAVVGIAAGRQFQPLELRLGATPRLPVGVAVEKGEGVDQVAVPTHLEDRAVRRPGRNIEDVPRVVVRQSLGIRDRGGKIDDPDQVAVRRRARTSP